MALFIEVWRILTRGNPPATISKAWVRGRVGLDRGETFFQVLGGEWVDNLDLQAFLLIKTLLERGVIAGELSLGHPLGSEDEWPVVLLGTRGRRDGEYQEECQYPVTGKTHPIKKHGFKYTVFS